MRKIRDIANSFCRFKEDPLYWREYWHYEFDKLLQEYELLPPQDWSSIDSVFIISTGRTGTKFLQKYFNEFEGTLSVHEPDPVFRKLSIDYAIEKCGNNRAKNEIEINRRALCRKVKREGCERYIESNPRFFSLIKPLKKIFSNPKIIHVVRDGRDFVRSGMSQAFGGFYSEKEPYSRIKADNFPDDYYFDKWYDLSQFEKNCWYWKKKDGFIYQDIKDYSKGITVRFEDIFKREEDYKGIKKISNFLGLDDDRAISIFKSLQENKINKSKQYSIPHWKKWNDVRKEKFDQIAGKHMKKYYDYDWT